MIRKTALVAATLAVMAAGTAASAETYVLDGDVMIHRVHMGDGPHPHPHPWGPGPRWGNKWGPYGYGPRPVPSRCTMVRAECSDAFRPGSFRWERCLARRGC